MLPTHVRRKAAIARIQAAHRIPDWRTFTSEQLADPQWTGVTENVRDLTFAFMLAGFPGDVDNADAREALQKLVGTVAGRTIYPVVIALHWICGIPLLVNAMEDEVARDVLSDMSRRDVKAPPMNAYARGIDYFWQPGATL